MRVLIFHGYLLRGTGSNVYTASVARALARAGHEVHLLCQDRRAEDLPWVDAIGDWVHGSLAVAPNRLAADRAGSGSITAYVPDIGGLLPVYVADRYEGFEVLTFPELADEQLEAYLAANVAAVRDVAERAGGIERALANHLVMGPAILARSGVAPYVAKIHGSALSYTVIPEPQRFLPYAIEGLESASAVLVGSAHTARSLWRTLDDRAIAAKTRLGPPGVDVAMFAPVAERAGAGRSSEDERRLGLRALAERLERIEPGGAFGRDVAQAATATRGYADASGPRVIFVGKLIVSKGVDLLLAAWPLVVRAHPDARLLLVGFGEYGDTLRRLWAALGSGDLATARRIAELGRELEGGERSRLAYLSAFVDRAAPDYADAARAAAASVDWAGRLEYQEVATVLRGSDAMVVPSTFPEAFGMVAAEAACSGALPVCARHSGLAEVAEALAAALPAELGGLTSFELGPGAVEEIADRLLRWLALDPVERRLLGASLRQVVVSRWSWQRVADTVLAAAAGELEALEPVADARFED